MSLEWCVCRFESSYVLLETGVAMPWLGVGFL